VTSHIHRYATLGEGERAVRDGSVDVLVADGRRLEWRRQNDEQLRAVVTGAIQLMAMRDRAAEAGISQDRMLAILAPVAVKNVEIGTAAGRSPDDETAAFIMTIVLFMTITTYGAMVLSGVVEEKASRVVEVLLARMPARNLLAGKIAGIGLLGLGQITVTAGIALAAASAVDTFDVPAVRGTVLAWIIVWFVLGYALYATAFGALGSLASRAEDAQSVSVVLIAGYFVSFAAIGSPNTIWARAVSYFPVTAPLAMPNRLAMGVAAWWEPLVAVALTLAAIAGLVWVGGRVYSRAVLHTGPSLKLREVWASDLLGVQAGGAGPTPLADVPPAPRSEVQPSPRDDARDGRAVVFVAVATGLVLGGLVAVVAGDVVIGVAVGAAAYALVARLAKARRTTERLHPSRH
jgi:ABC-2 type transport system permease protein